MMGKQIGVWLGRGLLALFVVAPVVVAALSPLGVGRATIWVAGTLAGVVATSLLVIQILLPTGWLNALLGRRNLRWHRVLGLSVLALVLAHVIGLYIYSPDDVSDALVLAAPTYSRLGVLSAWCLILSVVLALGRRKLPLNYSDWQILHSVLAVAVVGTAVGHIVLLQGTLDGPAEVLVCSAAVLAVSAAVIYWHIVRPLQRRRMRASYMSEQSQP